jgi:hypothetical protein
LHLKLSDTIIQITVDPQAIHEVRRLYAPPEHSVFELVPPTFKGLAQQLYADMGSPAVSRDNVWDVYRELLHRFRLLEALPPDYHVEWEEAATLAREDRTVNGDQFDLMPGLQDLPEGSRSDGFQYMGGVNNGHGIGKFMQFLSGKMYSQFG